MPLPAEVLARIEENRQKALERKRTFEQANAEQQKAASISIRPQNEFRQQQPFPSTARAPLERNNVQEPKMFAMFRGAAPGKSFLDSSGPTNKKNTPERLHAGASKKPRVRADQGGTKVANIPERAGEANIRKAVFGEAKLSEEQEQVLEDILTGKNVFITGCGGTGKSHLMHHAIKTLRELHGKTSVAVTATTGIAACHIGGTSLHTFAGIGLGQGSLPELTKKVNSNRSSRVRWERTKALVIDEVSMLDANLFDKLEGLAREVRRVNKPFGGIQVILVGDFLQLPPVGNRGEQVTFCFDSKSWKRVVDIHVELKHVFRQSNMEFVHLLNSVRWGKCTPEIESRLRSTMSNKLNDVDGVQATRLYCKNAQVDEINARSLHSLPGDLQVQAAEDSGEFPFLEQLKKNCMAPERLQLKIGAQVMLLKNIDPENGLVNGSRGVILSFQVNEDPDVGMLGSFPVVKFETNNGDKELMVYPEEFTIEGQGKVLAKRLQVPLRLAYAITIHKCQGMTLNKVEMSLKDVFEPGQAYVALSRVSSLEGLRLLDFSAHVVRAHPRVVQFYREMNSPEAKMEEERSQGSRENPLLQD